MGKVILSLDEYDALARVGGLDGEKERRAIDVLGAQAAEIRHANELREAEDRWRAEIHSVKERFGWDRESYTRTIDDLRAKLREAEKLRESEAAPASPTAPSAGDRKALLHALEIVSFAVANLPPETTRGWPVAHLEALAESLPPDLPGDDSLSLSIAYTHHAKRCRDIDANRERIIAAQRAYDAAHPDDRGPGAEHFADLLPRVPALAHPTPDAPPPEPPATSPSPPAAATPETAGGAGASGAPGSQS